MRCTDPRTVGFKSDGRTISWSQKHYSREYPTFQLPCNQCLECRLEYARQWAIRCVHEASVHSENSFITLTYADEHLLDPKLNYEDFQLFMKRLRFAYPNNQIGFFATGEYGEKNKRKHWHAILFGWRPPDSEYKYSNDRGDRVYSSGSLEKLWGYGITELGSVTYDSAGYCARYAAKKLVHGRDGDHDWHPISKKSNKHAIGKKWLEKFWPDVFNFGYIILPDGSQCGIPRYYEKWLKDNHPTEWIRYVTEVKYQKVKIAEERTKAEKLEYRRECAARGLKKRLVTRAESRKKIKEKKFKQLLEKQKL